MESRSKRRIEPRAMEEASETDTELSAQSLMEHGYASGGLNEYEEVVDT